MISKLHLNDWLKKTIMKKFIIRKKDSRINKPLKEKTK